MTNAIQRPLRRQGVIASRAGNRTVLRGPDGAELCELNDTARALWELCDGETSAEEIIDAVCAIHDAPGSALADDVYRALAAFVEVGALDHV